MDIAFDLWIHVGATVNSVESIFQYVEKPSVKTWLPFSVKACCLSRLEASLTMPPDLH